MVSASVRSTMSSMPEPHKFAKPNGIGVKIMTVLKAGTELKHYDIVDRVKVKPGRRERDQVAKLVTQALVYWQDQELICITSDDGRKPYTYGLTIKGYEALAYHQETLANTSEVSV